MSRIAAPTLLSLFLIIFFIASPASATTITIGDIVSEKDVNVSIMINDVEDVGSATINVSYDPSVIIVTHIEEGEFDSFTPNIYYAQDGWVKMTAYQFVSGLSGNVTFANLTISPRGSSGEVSDLDIDLETLSDNDYPYDTIDAEVIDGSFTIKSSGSVTPTPSPTAKPSGGRNGGSGWSTPTPTPTPSPSPSHTPSANETITPSPSPSPSSQPEETGIVTVQIGDATVERGELVNITIMIKGVVGEGLSSALINLTYDPKVVKVISVGNSDYDMFMPNIGKGIVRMVGFQTGAEGLKGDIKFAEIQVKAVGKVNESSELKLEVKELTDNVGKELKEHEDFEVENGYFSIKKGKKAEPEEPLKTTILILSVLVIIAIIVGSYFAIRLRRRK